VDAQRTTTVMITFRTRLLLIWASVVVAGTLAPFNFQAVADVGSLKMLQYGIFERSPYHFGGNILLFVPLGALLGCASRRQCRSIGSTLVVAGGAGFLISLTIESLQAFIPSRDSSLIDVVANTFGTLSGAVGDRLCGPSVRRSFHQLRVRTSYTVIGGVIATLLLAALLTSAALQARSRLTNWSLEFPLLVGNEQTGDRPWRGRVYHLAISDAAATPMTVERFSDGASIGLPGSTIATFDFSGVAPYRDATGQLPDLKWTEQTTESRDAGVMLTGGRWLRSEGPAAVLAERLRKTNAFTIDLSCAAEDPNQGGPARIVSNSWSPFVRNFTIGQDSSDLIVRVRNVQSGPNGTPPETILPGVFSSHDRRDILISYDGATLMAAVAQTHQKVHTGFGPASALALLFAPAALQRVTTPDALRPYDTAYVAGLFLFPAIVVALFGRPRGARVAIAIVYIVAAATLLEPTLTIVSGRQFDWTNVAATAGIGTGVFLALGLMLFPGEGLPVETTRQRAERNWCPPS
jgi:glycopeptide antibiotics resistance protein